MKTPPKKRVECPKCSHEFLVALDTLTCLRCRHRWVPRTFDVRQCPKCQSVRWDEPRETPDKPEPGSEEQPVDTPQAHWGRLRTILPHVTGKNRTNTLAKIAALEKEIAAQKGISS